MPIGTMTNVKHNLKEDPPGLGAPVRGRPDTHLPAADHQDDKSEAQTSGHAAESVKDKAGKHQSHGSCKSCGSLADKCSCENCQCQVCASKTGAAKEIEPPIKSATSATVVCGGSCIAAAQRATAGECPGCECPAGKCKCSKCHDKKDDGGSCTACDCPSGGKCPCTTCKCPVCKSTWAVKM
ncbi:hypothetical protein F443_01801 [Phytophthora nicotianae P1569]|uniref:Uncharacterized protein n=1 Tax=Phytophthora nicotianae P1569 TaxID=1317065 RepID=V9FYP4_PHYNI|nr:hypothetical protein F443_01801 [Phytophthora nicotianae P1569]